MTSPFSVYASLRREKSVPNPDAPAANRQQPVWLGLALAAISGALLGLAYAPVAAWWLAWVALVPLLVAASRSSLRGAFACGWVTGLVGFGIILEWLRLFGDPPFNAIMWLLAVGIEAAFVGVFALLARALLAGRPDGRHLLGVPALWTVCEWLRCTGPWGFPWGVLGETQAYRTTLIQFAALTGVWGITFLVALVNGYLAGVVLEFTNPSPSPSPKRRGEKDPVAPEGSPSPFREGGQGEGSRRAALRYASIPLAALALALAYGQMALRGAVSPGTTMRVAVIQGNVERDGGEGTGRGALATYIQLTRQVLGQRPDLVVWPETVVPGDLRRDFGLLATVEALAREGRCYLLVGTPLVDDRGGLKNAAALVSPEGRLVGWYEKVHLVPFGEYIPFRRWLPFLDRFPSVTDQSPGDGYRPLPAGQTRVGTMICFESAFPGISRALVRQGSGLLVVLTSDASFERSAAAEHHAAKAVFRAIETRRWLAQAATTGVSLVVDPQGRVRQRTGLFREETLVTDVTVGGPTTSYVRFGDWLVALCGLVIVGLVVRRVRERARLAAGLVACLVCVAGCGDDRRTPLHVEPDRYQRMVTAFYTGVTALKVGDDERARARLTEATRIIPREPAAWGDLALLEIRQHPAKPTPAAAPLERARSLAPPNGWLELLTAYLSERQDRSSEAIDHLRQAVALDGSLLLARYALIQAMQQQTDPQAAAEVRKQYEAILQAQPENVVAMLQLARIAVRNGDAGLRDRMMPSIRRASELWPPVARQKLMAFETAAAGPDRGAAEGQIAGLQNVVKGTPQYRQSFAALGLAEGAVAQPLERFLRLPSPRPSPAPSDTTLSFTTESLHPSRCAWARVLPLSPAPAPEKNEPPRADGPLTLVRAAGGTITLDTTPPAVLPLPGAVSPDGALLIDWNSDYRPDLALAGSGGVLFFQQSEASRWGDVTARAGLPSAVTSGAYTGAWALDVDLDGDLDIALGVAHGVPPVLRNNGDGTWSVVRPFAGLSGLRAFAWADLDGDGDPDVAAIDGGGNLVLFDNARSGHYRRWPVPTGIGTVRALAVADVNRDGTLDLVALTADGAIRRISRTAAGGWETAELARWPEAPADGSARLLWADLDNNGAVDLVASGSRGGRVWLADPNGALALLAAPMPARVLSVADLNGDGRLDLVGVSRDGKPVRLINRGSKPYHWQVLRPRNEQHIQPGESGNNKINSFGIGGEAELRAGLLVQKQPIEGPWLHFGMGEQPVAHVVRLIWPNGQPQAEFELRAGRQVMAKQRLTGSCPWLFADDGHSIRFVTDILWKSPLGLRINALDTAGVSQTRDWVKVRGDQLKARAGCYHLRITAELWETDFFDTVSLRVVDHPAGTELFVDERFSIPQPPLALHVTGPVRPVARATDDLGRDVTDVLRARDGRYLDTFGLGRYQGVTRDHTVELELPDTAPNAYLVANGWIYPTDSSINVAASQGRHPRPQGLSLEVPDGKGGWVKARSGLGFPAGKNKTILIDLKGVWDAATGRRGDRATGRDRRRVRLRTNLEIYWDAIGVADALPGTRLRTREIAPAEATLRYRGFSVVRQERRSSPELPEYNPVAGRGPQWLDLAGDYTRFGDVRELLAKVDDRYVIMNAGDEIALRFPAPAPPAPGWTRDFVFISDGWDKDGNFNTAFSTTVLPLPSHRETAYNRPPGRLEEDPVYRRHARDWQQYHTRHVTPWEFRHVLWPN